ncbi:MAG TPA: CYTH and CHAD domain-containing protein [Jiangellaceae bacterium]|nr:CYTH and CHAD domain-containing protein [Jiangellaceae bacterium]
MSTGAPVSVLREVEYKFRVHGLFRVPDLTSAGAVSVVEDHGVLALDSAYYDTADLRLAREGMTLRRRTGDDDEGWHLKLPVAGDGPEVRDENRLPLTAGDADAPPGALLDIVRVVLRHTPVQRVATLRTTRSRHVLHDTAGQPAAELLDDTVRVVDGSGRVSARFRELELEKGESTPDEVVTQVADALVDAGAVGGEFVSKAVRALGPQAAAPPEVPQPGDVGSDDQAHLAVRAFLARHTIGLRAADISFRRDPDGPWDSVHRMRVAARRLRSGLRVFRPLLDREWADALRGELAWLARGLGSLRELEVLSDRLRDRVNDLPDHERLGDGARVLDHIRREKADASRRAKRLLDSRRYLDLHQSLVTATATPPTTPAAEEPAGAALPPLVAKAWKRLEKKVDAVLADEASPAGAPDAEWHAARIAAKRARYAAEAVAPVLGKDAAALAGQLERITDILGAHQDAADAAGALRTMADEVTDPASGFVLGVLYAAERDTVRARRAEFVAVWPKVSRAKWRRWLDR